MSLPLIRIRMMVPVTLYPELRDCGEDSRVTVISWPRKLKLTIWKLTIAADLRFAELNSFVQLHGTANDRLRFAVAKPFYFADTYRPGYQPYPPARTDIGVSIPEVMNYFDDRDVFFDYRVYFIETSGSQIIRKWNLFQ